MPNVNDLSGYLRKDDIKEGDTLIFLDAGEIIERDFSPAKDGSKKKTVLEIGVELPDGRKKRMTLNVTSISAISEVYGKDTEAWVNKSVAVDYVRQLSFGKMADVLVLTPIIEK